MTVCCSLAACPTMLWIQLVLYQCNIKSYCGNTVDTLGYQLCIQDIHGTTMFVLTYLHVHETFVTLGWNSLANCGTITKKYVSVFVAKVGRQYIYYFPCYVGSEFHQTQHTQHNDVWTYFVVNFTKDTYELYLPTKGQY